jgi:hypothetical protein
VKRAAVALGGVAVAILAWRVLFPTRAAEPAAMSSATLALASPDVAPAADALPVTAPAKTAAPPPLVSAAPAAAPAPVRLDSPKETVETQIALLHADRDEELRATLLPAARATLTAEDLAFCKQKVKTRPVRPDWEMAEDGVTVDGHPIRRVSMFGKSMTGFVEASPGQWLADSVWCTQGRLP